MLLYFPHVSFLSQCQETTCFAQNYEDNLLAKCPKTEHLLLSPRFLIEQLKKVKLNEMAQKLNFIFRASLKHHSLSRIPIGGLSGNARAI